MVWLQLVVALVLPLLDCASAQSSIVPAVVFPTASAEGDWTLIKMESAAAATGAVCLDGSPAAYYHRTPLNSSTAGTNGWVVFMEGGGWCAGDSNCQQRSLTDLGSSKNYPAVMGPAEGTDFFAQFATFNIVYMKYCDGSSFTGDVEDPVKVPMPGGSTSLIYYRGRRILDALFDDLFSTRGLDKATEVLFSGCSAGALTTYVHADYVTALVTARAAAGVKTVALADAMFSLQYTQFDQNPVNYYTNQFTWGYTAWNSSASINQACRVALGPAKAWQCFHGAVAAQYVDTPLFIANSKYDTWQERGVLGLNTTECPGAVAADGTVTLCTDANPRAVSEGKYWRGYGDAMVGALVKVPKRHAAFLTNCPTHCETSGPGWHNSAGAGTSLTQAVAQWYPLAMLHRFDPTGFDAPRWLAADTDKCSRN